MRWVVSYEPQATAVKLAQLGEGCRGQAAPCREWIMSSNKNLRKLDKCCSPFKKHKKFL
jgi:hypothetical protein